MLYKLSHIRYMKLHNSIFTFKGSVGIEREELTISVLKVPLENCTSITIDQTHTSDLILFIRPNVPFIPH